jgi:hypothetical protein
LKENGIKYVFLGQELGGRPRTRFLYSEGVADYERWRWNLPFSKGLIA